MEGRRRIDQGASDSFVIEAGGDRFPFVECFNFAEMMNPQANLHEYVLKTLDKRFVRLTVVGDAEFGGGHGITRGWYVARMVDETEAREWRRSWAVLREQPDDPPGPWA